MSRGWMVAAALVVALVLPEAAQAGHSCRRGDPGIYASRATTCPFAYRIVSAYVRATAVDGPYHGAKSGTLRVSSPVTHKRYRLRFRVSGRTVRVRGQHDIRARFSNDFG